MEQLNEKQEQLLAYLEFKKNYIPMHEISVDLGYSIATIIKYINLLIEFGYVIQMSEGRLIKYSISELGKKYIAEKGLTFNEKDKLKSEEKNSKYLYKVKEDLLEIKDIKKNLYNQKKEFEEQKKILIRK